jgi:hypothetical protein
MDSFEIQKILPQGPPIKRVNETDQKNANQNNKNFQFELKKEEEKKKKEESGEQQNPQESAKNTSSEKSEDQENPSVDEDKHEELLEETSDSKKGNLVDIMI